MIRPLRRFTLCAAALLLAACGARPGTSLEEFRTAIYRPAYAAGFEIVGAEGLQSTILRTRTPWQGAAEGTATALFIARNGETPPAGFDGQTVEAGAQRIVCMSSTHVAMLDAVGAAPRIVGVSGRESIANGYVAAHPDRVGDVGYDGNVNYERLLSLRPDLVLLFGVNGASPMEPKLRELGIPFCYIGEYLEESPLGKAEWLVAVAETIDRREEGERAFAPIPERYEALKAKVAESAARPKVMINAPYGDSWFMASAESYVARLIADAGGDYIYRENTSNRSLPIDLEEAYLLASGADVWINAGSFRTLAEFRARLPKFAGVPCVRRGEIYNCDRRTNAAGGNDYWESGVVRPDVVLHDLIAVFHPEALDAADREMHYYRKLE